MDGFTPWPQEFADGYKAAGYWIDRTISEVLDESFDRFASRAALVTDDGREFTYERLGRLVNRLALHLASLGLSMYDRLILQIPNVAEVVITYLAALKAGLIPIMALPAHREAEIGYFAKLSDAKALAVASKSRGFDFQEMAARIQEDNPGLGVVLVVGEDARPGNHSIGALLDVPIEEHVSLATLPRPDPDVPAVLLLSGGTTGIPKLIPRTHNDYVYNFRRMAEVSDLNPDSKMLMAIPQEHNFAAACPGLKGLLTCGGCEILSSNPGPDAAAQLIERYGATHYTAVPTMILGLLNLPNRDKYNLSSLKLILTGGSKLTPEVGKRISAELKCDVQNGLGMAEGPLSFVRLDDTDESKIFTEGRPISPGDEYKIVDPATGDEVPPGEVGEFWCRGPYTIRGYYRAPEHNARAFSSDGFYKSGDLVRLHHTGNLVVVGRIKDCINRGGEKISAEEVENHIIAHPSVANCAYVAMPDPLLGERACTYIVPKPGKEITLESLNKFLIEQRKIAKFKLPERMEVVDEFPLTPVGKINKVKLREMVAAKLQAEQNA